MTSKLKIAKDAILSLIEKVKEEGHTFYIYCAPEEQMYFEQALTLTEVIVALKKGNHTVLITPRDGDESTPEEQMKLISLAAICLVENILDLSSEEASRMLKALSVYSTIAIRSKPVETAIKLAKYFPLSVDKADVEAGIKLYKHWEGLDD